ncbi:hypothetical protein Hanom_Chr13g01205221 [Helianthus anomalus]
MDSQPLGVSPMATSPHSNPEVAGSSLARSQCPYGSGFTPRLRLAGWRSARWDHLGGWEDRGISPPDMDSRQKPYLTPLILRSLAFGTKIPSLYRTTPLFSMVISTTPFEIYGQPHPFLLRYVVLVNG